MYELMWSKQAIKDWKRLDRSKYVEKAKVLLGIIEKNPYQDPPLLRAMQGSLKGTYSRKISGKHRMMYEVSEQKKEVYLIGMWTHYHE